MILVILPIANNYIVRGDLNPSSMSLPILIDFALVVKAAAQVSPLLEPLFYIAVGCISKLYI